MGWMVKSKSAIIQNEAVHVMTLSNNTIHQKLQLGN